MKYRVDINLNKNKRKGFGCCYSVGKHKKNYRIHLYDKLDIFNKYSILAHEFIHLIFKIMNEELFNGNIRINKKLIINGDPKILFTNERIEDICTIIQKQFIIELFEQYCKCNDLDKEKFKIEPHSVKKNVQ